MSPAAIHDANHPQVAWARLLAPGVGVTWPSACLEIQPAVIVLGFLCLRLVLRPLPQSLSPSKQLPPFLLMVRSLSPSGKEKARHAPPAISAAL